MSRRLAIEDGILAGILPGANLFASLKVLEENPGACIVTIASDRGERYLNLGLYGCNAQVCKDSSFCKSGEGISARHVLKSYKY